MEFEGVKEIHDRFESILSHLKSQFSKFTEERESREIILRKEANRIENKDLDMSNQIINFLEWDSTALLLEEQRVQTYGDYVSQLYKFLGDLKSQRERITELTEELETKEEDITLMAELLRKKDDDIQALKESNIKMMDIIKKTRPGPKPQKPTVAIPIADDIQDLESPHEELMRDLGSKRKNKKKTAIKCAQCGKTEFRRTKAKFCVECAYARKKKVDRTYQQKKYDKRDKLEYDSKGDVIEESIPSDDDDPITKDQLDEKGDYESVGSENNETTEDEEK